MSRGAVREGYFAFTAVASVTPVTQLFNKDAQFSKVQRVL